MISMNNREMKPVRIKVIGVGGAGSNALDQMVGSEISNIEYISVNTDMQALQRSKAGRKIQIGDNVTHGLGAGGNPGVGRQAALDSLPEIEEAVKGADILFLVAGFGGGTGTGALPVAAQAARERDILTVCIGTIPFEFEGQKRKAQAIEGLRRAEEFADTVVGVSNDRLFQIADRNLSMVEAFAFTNDVIAEGVQCIARLINMVGLINLDFADVKTIVSRGGRAALGFGVGKGEGSAVGAAQKALDNPLFNREKFERARGLLISIMGGDDLGITELREAAEMVSREGNRNANIIFGAVVDEKYRGQRMVTVLATGFDRDERETEVMLPEAEPEHIHYQKAEQTLINLDFTSTEHFGDTEPTFIEGENLDIPTFLRRNVEVRAAI